MSDEHTPTDEVESEQEANPQTTTQIENPNMSEVEDIYRADAAAEEGPEKFERTYKFEYGEEDAPFESNGVTVEFDAVAEITALGQLGLNTPDKAAIEVAEREAEHIMFELAPHLEEEPGLHGVSDQVESARIIIELDRSTEE